jgi:hypothetical protein
MEGMMAVDSYPVTRNMRSLIFYRAFSAALSAVMEQRLIVVHF